MLWAVGKKESSGEGGRAEPQAWKLAYDIDTQMQNDGLDTTLSRST